MAMRALRIARHVASAVILASAGGIVAAVATDQARPDPAALRAAYAGPPASWPRPQLREGAVFTEFAPLPVRAEPDAREAAMIALGRQLFDDPILSKSRQIACASCHARELGFADGLATSFGHDRQRGRRNSQGLLTVGWMTPMFWDGRATTLEEQALHPIIDRIEMAADMRTVERRVNRNAAYRQGFAKLTGKRRVDRTDIASALAAFQRSLRPPTTRYTRFVRGETRALTDEQLRGLDLFRGKAGCANCHSGPVLSDQRFHNLGLSFFGRAREDLGRYEVTGKAEDVGTFRTPSLLGIGRTAPYMHNGLLRSLDNVVAFYNGGGGRDRRAKAWKGDAPPPRPDPLLQPLGLSPEERAALVAFLETL